MTINENAAALAGVHGVKSSSRGSNHTGSRTAVQSADPFELILSHADGVRRLGADRAIFKAPTRSERSASVSICRSANGSVLLHDFGGDSAADILAALGLGLASLYPERDRRDMTPVERAEMRMRARLAGWSSLLSTIGLETKIVVIAGRQIAMGHPLDKDDAHRLVEALDRIDRAREVLIGH